jgi:hypothetical protein
MAPIYWWLLTQWAVSALVTFGAFGGSLGLDGYNVRMRRLAMLSAAWPVSVPFLVTLWAWNAWSERKGVPTP